MPATAQEYTPLLQNDNDDDEEQEEVRQRDPIMTGMLIA